MDQFSAGWPNSTSVRGDTASGDSGGPAVQKGRLVGLTTGARKNEPGIYTLVGYYREWIEAKIAERQARTIFRVKFGLYPILTTFSAFTIFIRFYCKYRR